MSNSDLRTRIGPPRTPEEIKNDTAKQIAELLRTIKGYKELVKAQQREREILLEHLSQISNQAVLDGEIFEKLNELSQMVKKLTEKIDSIDKKVSNSTVVISSANEIKNDSSFEKELEQALTPVDNKILVAAEEKIALLTSEIEKLSNKVRILQNELDKKDETIKTLNQKLELLVEEREQLRNELNRLNRLMMTWEQSISIIEKLAKTDPRYKVLNIVKKNKELNEIQLAFACGLSISELRKYVEDLRKLELVIVDGSKIKWSGKDIKFTL